MSDDDGYAGAINREPDMKFCSLCGHPYDFNFPGEHKCSPSRLPVRDGTPGPARVAVVREAYERLSALEAWTRPFSLDGEREKILATLVSGDSGGPREAPIEQATEYLRDFIQYEPGTTMRPQREKADSCLSFILSRLRAELGRAPNGWEEAAKVCDDEAVKYRHTTSEPKPVTYYAPEGILLREIATKLRSRAAAPDAERFNG